MCAFPNISVYTVQTAKDKQNLISVFVNSSRFGNIISSRCCLAEYCKPRGDTAQKYTENCDNGLFAKILEGHKLTLAMSVELEYMAYNQCTTTEYTVYTQFLHSLTLNMDTNISRGGSATRINQ